MAIEFTCPNGHRLSTRDDDAGKMAKCPKCAAITKVPGLNGSASSGKDSAIGTAAVASGSDKGLAVLAGSSQLGAGKSGSFKLAPSGGGPKETKGDAVLAGASGLGQMSATANGGKGAGEFAAPAEESIVFLCPNGHRLNAPRRMQGHAGKCPHCGAKFRIPFIEEAGAQEEGSRVDDLGTFNDLVETGSANQPANAPAAPAKAPAARSPGDDFQFWESDQHPLAALVMRLWSEREHGGVIELHLAGGAIFLPDWFERRLSQGPHGLFASQAADGTVTMTIIPWDTITRVVVRGVVGLPDGMFE